jgi:hypothetical protein
MAVVQHFGQPIPRPHDCGRGVILPGNQARTSSQAPGGCLPPTRSSHSEKTNPLTVKSSPNFAIGAPELSRMTVDCSFGK